MPERIQLRRTKGWRKPEGAVVVARPTKWGNPFSVDEWGRDGAVEMFEAWLARGDTVPYPKPGESAALSERRERMLGDLRELKGRDLCCWCKPDQRCHADTLIEAANGDWS